MLLGHQIARNPETTTTKKKKKKPKNQGIIGAGFKHKRRLTVRKRKPREKGMKWVIGKLISTRRLYFCLYLRIMKTSVAISV